MLLRQFIHGESILTAKHMTAGLILLAALALSACNTVQGMGRDVQSVGKTVEGTAK
jgi:predicted small secreted protein